MTVVSPVFLAIGLLAVAAVYLLPARVPRDLILLAASLGFVAAALDPASLAGLAAFVLAGFALLRVVERQRRPGVLAAAVAAAVALFWLLGENDVALGAALGLPRPEPVVLLGLSYVMFRVVHLLVDVGQGELAAPVGLRGYLGYLLFFPNFLAGPIQRYEDLAPQLATPSPPDRDGVRAGLARMLAGGFSTVVLSGLAFAVFRRAGEEAALGGAAGGLALGVATLAFSAYLYASFTGYMDMAIGLGRLLGIAIPENFDRPWLASNFLDFWARWHITLSEWFKFYLFNPSTKELLRAVDRPAAAPWLGAAGYFLTFFVMGIWHGTSLSFAVYGLLLGLGVSLNKAWQVWMVQRLGRRGYNALSARRWYAVAARTAALSWFALALVLVWSDLATVSASLASLGAAGAASAVGLVVVVVGCGAALGPLAARLSSGLGRLTHSAGTGWLIAVAQAGAIAYYLLVVRGVVPELIYQRF
ncbi:MAG: MBOAT family O-acyltransferase [Thalassobaculum sp.]|uniref:MBOAT family O-acyltransferase n=1 Tax=Thalassobaculum sp. TaxID=2022740 RepID=UPI0032EDEBC5